MNDTVYLYFNRPDPGPLHNWHDWQGVNPDEIKMAAVTAHSWARHGWQVKRLTSENFPVREWWLPRRDGRIARRIHEYPLEFWQLIPMILAKDLAPCWVTTCDILNQGFHPGDDSIGGCDLYIPWPDFTLAAFHVTPAGCRLIMDFVDRFDRGELPDDSRNYSEEMICRMNMVAGEHYGHALRTERVGAAVPFLHEGRLIHFSRSTVPMFYQHIPAV